MSLYRKYNSKLQQKNATFLFFNFTDALHVSGDSSAHHQEFQFFHDSS